VLFGFVSEFDCLECSNTSCVLRANSDSKLSRMAGEVQQSYPVWQEKFVKAHVLFMYPAQ
jgi:hypothetical protein